VEALNEGVKVIPKVNQKAPKEPKTTKGKVLPIIHCVKLVLMSEDEETGLSFRQTGFTYFSDRTEDHEDAAE
jgi:hypothetical protein